MKLTEQQVQHVAKLARLALSPHELAQAREQLSAVLDAVDTLQQVKTDGVPPMSHVMTTISPTRPDVVVGELTSEAAFANAPEVNAGAFAIPRVIE